MLVLAGDDAVWGTVYEATERSVVRIDPGTNATTTVVGPLPPAQIASIGVGGTVWVADWDTSSITGYDIATGDAVAELPVGLHPIEPVAAFGDLWSLDHHGGTVTRIDTETRTVEATITVGAPGERGPNSAAAGGGLLWVVTPNTPVVVAIDPETSTIARRLRLDEDTCVSAVSYVADRVWLRECEISRVIVLDPRSGEHLGVVDAVALGVPLEITGDAWVVTRLPGQTSSGLAKVDPDSLQIIDEFETGVRNEPLLFVAFDSLWIVAGPQVTRVPLATVTEGG
jgi:YVTN family beta-propeller protein